MYSNLLELGVLIFTNTFSLLLTILVLANSSKGNKNFWLAAMSIAIIGWVNTAFLGFALPDPEMALFFYRLNGAFVPLFLISAYYFYFENFLGIRNNIVKGIHITVNVGISIIALFTGEMVSSVEQMDWGNDLVVGGIFTFFILYSALFSAVLAILLLRKYIMLGKGNRKEVMFFLTGTVFFIVSNVIFNVLSPLITGSSRFQHFGDYSSVIFLAFTVYAIFRTNFLNIKTAATSVLIALLGMLILVDIFVLSRSLVEQGVKFFVLMLFATLSVFLVRSVLNEIRQKEELEKVNKALDKSRQRYLDLATEQKDIIDVMGHEIRTPLTAIVQEIKLHKKHTLPLEKELLAEGKGDNLKKLLPLVFDTLKTVDRASGHAVALVSDMLETARLDKKRFTLNYEKFDLVSVAAQSVELMTKTVEADTRAGAVKYDIQFVKPSFEILEVEADKTRIGQAMYAMLNNAIKYRDPGKDTVKVRLSVAKKGSEVIVEIVDNGIGIAKEDISKLGKKFLRLNPKTNGNLERPGGTGLGLFVVKGIMEYHHGKLEIESEGITKGSTFKLRFPLAKSGKSLTN